MNNKNLNVKIAKVLGFKNNPKYSGFQYPKEWEYVEVASPSHYLPDFVGMLKEYIELKQKMGGICDFDYHTSTNIHLKKKK